ncbi:hypothetical protein M5K25_013559 [Dendrobium thyrsiflorum]|uniref:Uncharacterized protein n=1 Tax=Dendrobium thyrsiflorum TaxID=117978 RepID=A0ABD0V051_DENTH
MIFIKNDCLEESLELPFMKRYVSSGVDWWLGGSPAVVGGSAREFTGGGVGALETLRTLSNLFSTKSPLHVENEFFFELIAWRAVVTIKAIVGGNQRLALLCRPFFELVAWRAVVTIKAIVGGNQRLALLCQSFFELIAWRAVVTIKAIVGGNQRLGLLCRPFFELVAWRAVVTIKAIVGGNQRLAVLCQSFFELIAWRAVVTIKAIVGGNQRLALLCRPFFELVAWRAVVTIKVIVGGNQRLVLWCRSFFGLVSQRALTKIKTRYSYAGFSSLLVGKKLSGKSLNIGDEGDQDPIFLRKLQFIPIGEKAVQQESKYRRRRRSRPGILTQAPVSGEKVAELEAENKKSRILIAEKEAALFGLESSRVIEDFKKSIAFNTIIQDHVQEAREHIYDVEVKALEQQCMDEGFTRDFLNRVRLVQCKAGVKIDGLITSQAFEDPSSDLDGAEIESGLRKAFSSDDESVDVECDLPWMVLMPLLQQGFVHQDEKRQMPGIPDSEIDSWTCESWSERLLGGDCYACWPLKQDFASAYKGGISVSHRRRQTSSGVDWWLGGSPAVVGGSAREFTGGGVGALETLRTLSNLFSTKSPLHVENEGLGDGDRCKWWLKIVSNN